jgi:hypothetical protein
MAFAESVTLPKFSYREFNSEPIKPKDLPAVGIIGRIEEFE